MTRFGTTASQDRSSNAIISAMTVLMASVMGSRRRKKSITVSLVSSNGEKPLLCKLVFINAQRPPLSLSLSPFELRRMTGRRACVDLHDVCPGSGNVVDGNEGEGQQAQNEGEGEGSEFDCFHGYLRKCSRPWSLDIGSPTRGICAGKPVPRRKRG